MTPDEVRRLVAESRARQGLPPTVEDPAAVARIARLLRAIEHVERRSCEGCAA